MSAELTDGELEKVVSAVESYIRILEYDAKTCSRSVPQTSSLMIAESNILSAIVRKLKRMSP